MKSSFAALVVLLFAGWGFLSAGCSFAEAQSGRADITGHVRFIGTPPSATIIDRSMEPGCELGTAYDETVLSWDGRLANVHVAIEVGSMGVHPVPKKPAIVQQSDCLYVPRVQGLMRGQKLLVTNGDAAAHNVHAKSKSSSITNKMQPSRAAALEIDSSKAGDVLTLGCDIHSWMRAYMPITDHPFFDVTGTDGAFVLRGVPSGKKVTVRAWHERFGEQTKTATAGDSLTFSFSSF